MSVGCGMSVCMLLFCCCQFWAIFSQYTFFSKCQSSDPLRSIWTYNTNFTQNLMRIVRKYVFFNFEPKKKGGAGGFKTGLTGLLKQWEPGTQFPDTNNFGGHTFKKLPMFLIHKNMLDRQNYNLYLGPGYSSYNNFEFFQNTFKILF